MIRAALATLALLLAACGAPSSRPVPPSESPFDELPGETWERFEEVRVLEQAGQLNAARALLEQLGRELPGNVSVGIALQDVLLELEAGGPEGSAALRERFRERARTSGDAASCVLAARLEDEPAAARAWLERALALDPGCAWAHYGSAWLAAQGGDWTAARAALARALEADPGHLRAHWLEAWVAARSGRTTEASRRLRGWLDRAAADPRAGGALLDEARLDLALLLVLENEPREAARLIESLAGRGSDAARRLEALACVQQALGDVHAALEAAQEAGRIDPARLLPEVQQALLCAHWLDDPAGAQVHWQRVLELARQDGELSAILERTRALVRLERAALARPVVP